MKYYSQVVPSTVARILLIPFATAAMIVVIITAVILALSGQKDQGDRLIEGFFDFISN